MTQTAPPADRPHAAAKRYIYAWGGGHAEGDATMRDLLGGKGAGLAEMTNAGLPVPPGFTITTEACNDYFTAGEQLPAGPVGRRPGGGPRGRGPDRQGLRQRRRPAPRLGPLRRQVLHARDDGHGPQPRPERGDAPRDGRPDRQRAVRLGRLPALHPDVRPDRHGGEAGALRRGARGEEARPRRRAGHRADGGRPARARRRVQGDRPGRHRARLPERPVRAARPRDQGRLRVVVRQARHGLPEQPAHRPRPRDRGQRRDHGLRQHGRRLGHRRRLHARPEHRREDPLRRVPHQRPGRGRRRRHPDRAEDRPDADRHARGLQRVPADRPAARAPLPRRPGPRVHDRARQAVHAPDALGEADRRGGRPDRHGPRGRGPHHQGRGARPDRAGPRRPAPARPVRPGGPDRGHRAWPRGSTRRPARPSARRCSTRTPRSSGWPAASASSSSGSRRRPTTSTAWPSPRAS